MDSMDLEREKGITILAKNTAVKLPRRRARPRVASPSTSSTPPGTPTSAARWSAAWRWSTGSLLLVDASEGPLPQTRFVLRKALQKRLPVVLVINKVDRPDARIAEVVDETYELFFDLDADLPTRSTSRSSTPRRGPGGRSPNRPADGEMPDAEDLEPLFETILATVPPPEYDDEAAAAGARHEPRLLALPRPARAVPRAQRHDPQGPDRGAGAAPTAASERVRITELLMTEALDRVPAAEAGPGDIIAVAGIPEITIGETLADPEDPRPLPVITVDEPSISMTIGINTAPLAGQSGTKLTARLLKNRLDAELVGNVSIRVLATERPDTWEVQGRGELQLAVLVEMMRREGFELTVGKPQVVTRDDRRQALRADGAPDDRRARGLPRAS